MSKLPITRHSDRCINPFENSGMAGHTGKDLRTITKSILNIRSDLPKNCKVCGSCRKRLKRSLETDDSTCERNGSMDSDHLCSFANNPDDSTNSQDSSVGLRNKTENKSTRQIELEELLQGIKNKFHSLAIGDPLRLQLLTLAPDSWSVNKVAHEFEVSWQLAKKANNLKLESGIFPDIASKTGRTLSPDIVKRVTEFYDDDQNSRIMPGIKDVQSIVLSGNRTLVQKRLLFMGLKELYALYKEKNTNDKVGFSTFAKLRPKNCILPGANGTHSVCVCTIHENCKLILDAIDIKKLTKDWTEPIHDYKSCLNMMICKSRNPECYLNECHKCPGIHNLSSKLFNVFKENNITEVQYNNWTVTDRSTLQTITSDASDVIEDLCEKLTALKPHSFIAKQQSLFIAEKKENLLHGEVLVMFDFSENYSYVVQNASQAFHFNNNQCTVFPVIYYYREGSEIKHQSCIFLSDSIKHDTAAVATIKKKLILEIRGKVKSLKKIIYNTDGAKQHFKNKYQICNLIHHKEDYGVDAEWHYCVTAHGKSHYDGIGATFKREAYRTSLTLGLKVPLLTFDRLYTWAEEHFKSIKIFRYTQIEHNAMTRKLKKRFESALPVPGISQNHGFIAQSKSALIIKRYSNAAKGVKVNLLKGGSV